MHVQLKSKEWVRLYQVGYEKTGLGKPSLYFNGEYASSKKVTTVRLRDINWDQTNMGNLRRFIIKEEKSARREANNGSY